MTTQFLATVHRMVLQHDGGGLNDHQLLEVYIQENCDAAFKALVKRHGPMVLNTCWRVTGNRHDAEDAFQNTFAVLARKASSITTPLATWLHRVAFNEAVDVKEKGARQREIERSRQRECPESEVDSSDAASAAERLEVRRLVDREIHRLKPKYRDAVILCRLQGLSRKKAARQLGIPPGTVSSRENTAVNLLRERLRHCGVTAAATTITAVLAPNAATASVPATLVASAVKAATASKAGSAVGWILANVAALTKGVLKALLGTKLKVATVVLLTSGLFSVFASALVNCVGTDQPCKPMTSVIGSNFVGPASQVLTPLTSEFIIGSQAATTANKGTRNKGTNQRSDDQVYGDDPSIWLQFDSKGEISHMHIGSDRLENTPEGFVTGRVSRVSPDGKSFSIRAILKDGDEGNDRMPQWYTSWREVEFRIADTSKVSYCYVPEGTDKPYVDYQADIWRDPHQGLTDGCTVAMVKFTSVAGLYRQFWGQGTIVAFHEDTGFTVKFPRWDRGAQYRRREFKPSSNTKLTFHGKPVFWGPEDQQRLLLTLQDEEYPFVKTLTYLLPKR